jgi:hypothetical protein
VCSAYLFLLCACLLFAFADVFVVCVSVHVWVIVCFLVCKIGWFNTLQPSGMCYPVEEIPRAVCTAISNILKPMDAMPVQHIVLQQLRDVDPYANNMATLTKLFPKVACMPRVNHKYTSVFFQDPDFMRSYQFQSVVCLFKLIETGFVLKFGSWPSHFRDNTNTKQSSARPHKTTSVHIQAVATSYYHYTKSSWPSIGNGNEGT